MKLDRPLESTIRFLPFILVFGLLAGCLPGPHSTERSQEIQGKVLDARTHSPIQGAKIFLTYRPSISTETDAAGHFQLRATQQFQLAYNEGGGWPDRKYENEVTISHTNYLSRDFYGPFFYNSLDNSTSGIVLLEPKQ